MGEDGCRPLHRACQRGHEECVAFLVDSGVDCAAVDKDGHDARWHIANAAGWVVGDAAKVRMKAILDAAVARG